LEEEIEYLSVPWSTREFGDTMMGILQRGFGTPSPIASRTNSDADNNLAVDGADLDI